jgi:hypothetical protein
MGPERKVGEICAESRSSRRGSPPEIIRIRAVRAVRAVQWESWLYIRGLRLDPAQGRSKTSLLAEYVVRFTFDRHSYSSSSVSVFWCSRHSFPGLYTHFQLVVQYSHVRYLNSHDPA